MVIFVNSGDNRKFQTKIQFVARAEKCNEALSRAEYLSPKKTRENGFHTILRFNNSVPFVLNSLTHTSG